MSKPPSMPTKLLALAINLIIGQTPCILFFIWVERNCMLPWNKWGLDFPLIDLKSHSLPVKLMWNAVLILMFGVIHTTFAQPFVHQRIRKFLAGRFIRTLYILMTSFSVSLLMSCWQNTGIELYSLPLPKKKLDVLSVTVFTLLWSGNMYPFMKFGILNLFGIEQIFQKGDEIERTEGTKKLITNGVYGTVRHPIYTFTMGAFAVAPRMTLDRAWVLLFCLVYLFSLGIPREDKKLVKEFGQPYLEYRKKVPAVVPNIPFLQKKEKFVVKSQ